MSVSINSVQEFDPWFLFKIKNIVDMEDSIRRKFNSFDEQLIRKAKKWDFQTSSLARCLNLEEMQVRNLRHKFNIRPVVKQIDTLAAEWPAKTNYLYLSYGRTTDDVKVKDNDDNNKSSMIVLGAGPYRIGSER